MKKTKRAKRNPLRIFTKQSSARKFYNELRAKGEDVGIAKDHTTGIWKVLWAPRKRNPAPVKAVRLKNFSGTITKLKNGQVKITGRAKKR